jgi:hypothetical protein
MFDRKLGLGLIFLMFFIACPEAEGADWKLYAKNSNFRLLYEAEGMVRPSAEIVQVWSVTKGVSEQATDHLQALGQQSGVSGHENLEYSMELYEFNCSEKKFKVRSVLYYGLGHNLLDSSKEESEFKDIEPYSNIEALYQAVCEEKAAR